MPAEPTVPDSLVPHESRTDSSAAASAAVSNGSPSETDRASADNRG